jgi:hypothetical protein
VRNRDAFRRGFEFTDHSLARDMLAHYLHSDQTLVSKKAHVANYWIVESKNRVVIAKFGGRLTIAEAEQYAADLRNNSSFESFDRLRYATSSCAAEFEGTARSGMVALRRAPLLFD